MNTYRVFMINVVSSYLDVDAESEEEAMDLAEQEGLPGLMMLDHRYPDDSGWTADEVILMD